MMILRDSLRNSLLILLLFIGIGCGATQSTPPEQSDVLTRQVRIEELTRQLAAKEQRVLNLQTEINNLRVFPLESQDHLIRLDTVEFGRYTRIITEPSGQNTLILYLITRDKQANRIKTAGRLTIELWDLSHSDTGKKRQAWTIPLENLNRYWMAGMLTEHYKLILPLSFPVDPSRPLTLKADLTEALTGKEFTLQKMVTSPNP